MKKNIQILMCLVGISSSHRINAEALRAPECAISAVPVKQMQSEKDESARTSERYVWLVAKLYLRLKMHIKLHDSLGEVFKYVDYGCAVGQEYIDKSPQIRSWQDCLGKYIELVPELNKWVEVESYSTTQLLSKIKEAFFMTNPRWAYDIPRSVAEEFIKNSLVEMIEQRAEKAYAKHQTVIAETVKSHASWPAFIQKRPWFKKELIAMAQGFVRGYIDRVVQLSVYRSTDFAFGVPFSRRDRSQDPPGLE